jgi:hypothetical protein
MAIADKIIAHTLYRSKLKTVLKREGIRVDWDRNAIKVIEKEIDKIERQGALLVKRKAQRMAPQKTGALRDSIRTQKSKYEHGGWLVFAGDDEKVNYAGHVELGRYYKKTGTRVEAVPFMRRSIRQARRALRGIFIRRLRRAFK